MVKLNVNDTVRSMEAMCQNTGKEACISPVMHALFGTFVIASSLQIKFSFPEFDDDLYETSP